MQVAHHVTLAKRLNPAAAPTRIIAVGVLAVWQPTHIKRAEHAIPTHTAACRPRRRPKALTAKSENHPPTGDSTKMARKGVAPHRPPRMTVSPRARVR